MLLQGQNSILLWLCSISSCPHFLDPFVHWWWHVRRFHTLAVVNGGAKSSIILFFSPNLKISFCTCLHLLFMCFLKENSRNYRSFRPHQFCILSCLRALTLFHVYSGSCNKGWTMKQGVQENIIQNPDGQKERRKDQRELSSWKM